MANAFTSLTGTSPSGQWADLAAAALDRAVAYKLRAMPQWRALVDKRPVRQNMPGTSVKFTLLNEFSSLATTALTETVDPDSDAPPAPDSVTVTPEEYGKWANQTARLLELSWAEPSPELAQLLAFNMADTIDSLVQTVVDGSTNILEYNGSTVTTTDTVNSITAANVADSELVARGVGLLRRRNAMPRDGANFIAVAHPDVLADLMLEDSASAWNRPHNYVDTAAVYAGEVGTFRGARFIETTRVKAVDNTAATPVKIYSTYLLGREAIAEATVVEPHVVIGAVTSPLKRFVPIGWRAHLGWALYRTPAIQVLKSSSGSGSL